MTSAHVVGVCPVIGGSVFGPDTSPSLPAAGGQIVTVLSCDGLGTLVTTGHKQQPPQILQGQAGKDNRRMT